VFERVHACLAISLAFATSVKIYSFMLWGGAAVSGHVGACLDVFGTGIAAATFLNTVPISDCFNANATVCCDPK